MCLNKKRSNKIQAIFVRIDRAQNFRGLAFGDSAGTETAVRCAGPTILYTTLYYTPHYTIPFTYYTII